jgi:hypothetical protein
MLFTVIRIGAGLAGGAITGYGTHMLFEKAFEGVAMTTVQKGCMYVTEGAIAAAGAKEAYKLFSMGRDMEDDEKMMEIMIQQKVDAIMNSNNLQQPIQAPQNIPVM